MEEATEAKVNADDAKVATAKVKVVAAEAKVVAAEAKVAAAKADVVAAEAKVAAAKADVVATVEGSTNHAIALQLLQLVIARWTSAQVGLSSAQVELGTARDQVATAVAHLKHTYTVVQGRHVDMTMIYLMGVSPYPKTDRPIDKVTTLTG
jgi:multidrug resistance efflux pump